MAKPRYLTKSRFKTGYECASKLHFLDDPSYASDKLDDKFLQALADGGFQVGELAKLYFPGGVEVEERDHLEAVRKTDELLARNEVTIFEAALMFENLFIRVDILVKKGNAVRLYEVKAKSWRDGDSFTTTKGDKLDSSWEPYIADIAFQRHVASLAKPQFAFATFLYLANKDAKASVSGIHQRFFLNKAGSRTAVEVVSGTTKEVLGTELLKAVPTDIETEMFVNQDFDGLTFDKYVAKLSELAASRLFVASPISRACGGCEYRIHSQDRSGKGSGFKKCWTHATNLAPEKLDQPMIFDVWNLHYRKKDKLIEDGRYFVSEIVKEDIEPEDDDSSELSPKQRQWLQVESTNNGSIKPYFDADHFQFRAKTERWRAPYHFIDFETLTSAIPFHKGLRPYDTIAFQFSHHVINRDGSLVHKTQYINVTPGEFPNFEFARALKKALSDDDGTVFRYAAHENTVLNHIRAQLLESEESDREDLVKFIDTLTVRKEKGKIVHQGMRCMVDMLELVKKLYYSPLMGGSNSIKKVLPSVLQESDFLKAKYSQPTYGSSNGFFSHNFKNKAWIKVVDSKVEDPYKALEPIFFDMNPDEWAKVERLFTDDEIREGGSASTAYARMQFTRMSETERMAIAGALLRYCELDTLAMVMIWEYWTQELVKKAKKVA